MSAQLASLYCMACEYVQLSKELHTISFYKIIRFRDNIILFLLHDVSYQDMLIYLSLVYKLQFTKENAGKCLQCLEFEVNNIYTEELLQRVSLSWKGSKLPPETRPEMTQIKWVSANSQNAKYICQVYLPSALKKCQVYAQSHEDFVCNVKGLYDQLSQTDYPRTWYKCVWATLYPRKGIG